MNPPHGWVTTEYGRPEDVEMIGKVLYGYADKPLAAGTWINTNW